MFDPGHDIDFDRLSWRLASWLLLIETMLLTSMNIRQDISSRFHTPGNCAGASPLALPFTAMDFLLWGVARKEICLSLPGFAGIAMTLAKASELAS